MAPGDRWVFRETDGEGGEQRVEVTVTDDVRTVMGIEARVVHDVVTEDGQLVEDTYDWYAQDADGNAPVLALGISGGAGREELVSFRRG